MMNKVTVNAILEALYQEVEKFDDIQEKIIEICLKINKLDNERDVYLKLDIPDIINNVLKSVDSEITDLVEEKVKLEAKLSLINIEKTLERISHYEHQ
jgi:hypothetical protein